MVYTGAGFGIGLIALGVISVVYSVFRFMADSCSYPELQQDFSIVDYTGLWYEFAKTPNAMQKG